MKIIIDIDENVFTRLFGNGVEDYAIVNDDLFSIAKSIRLCTPLIKVINQIEDEKDFAYADFERYKVECLGQDWEDAYDGLPDDDFRYGMERALDIICEHIKENKQ